MIPAEPSVTFRLAQAGWADLLIDGPDGPHSVSGISYLSDALDDIVRLGIEIATHRYVATAQVFHEPGSTLLIAQTGWWSGMDWEFGARLHAVDGPDYGDGELTLSQMLALPFAFSVTFSSPDAMAAALLAAAEAVEAEHGHGGYAALWTGARGFPMRAVAALRAALAAPPSERLNYGG